MKKQKVAIVLLTVLFLAPPLLAAQDGYTSHSSDQYMLDFSHPEGWYVTEHEDSLVLLSSPELEERLDAEFPDLETGEMVVTVSALPALMFVFMGIEADSVGGQLEGFLEMMVQEIPGASESVTRSSEEASNGVAVSSLTFDTTEEIGGEDREVSGTFLGVADEDKGVVTFAFAVGRRPTLNQEQEALVETVGSMVYTGEMEELMGGN